MGVNWFFPTPAMIRLPAKWQQNNVTCIRFHNVICIHFVFRNTLRRLVTNL